MNINENKLTLNKLGGGPPAASILSCTDGCLSWPGEEGSLVGGGEPKFELDVDTFLESMRDEDVDGTIDGMLSIKKDCLGCIDDLGGRT